MPDPATHDELVRTQIRQLQADGERCTKIQMIKAVREASDLDLKEAKDAVDDYIERHPEEAPYATVSTGCARVLLLLLGSVSLAAFFAAPWQ